MKLKHQALQDRLEICLRELKQLCIREAVSYELLNVIDRIDGDDFCLKWNAAISAGKLWKLKINDGYLIKLLQGAFSLLVIHCLLKEAYIGGAVLYRVLMTHFTAY